MNFCSDLTNRNKSVVRNAIHEILQCQFPQPALKYEASQIVYPKKVYAKLVNKKAVLAFSGPNEVFNKVGHYGTISIINRLFGKTIAKNLKEFAKLIVAANSYVEMTSFIE